MISFGDLMNLDIFLLIVLVVVYPAVSGIVGLITFSRRTTPRGAYLGPIALLFWGVGVGIILMVVPLPPGLATAIGMGYMVFAWFGGGLLFCLWIAKSCFPGRSFGLAWPAIWLFWFMLGLLVVFAALQKIKSK